MDKDYIGIKIHPFIFKQEVAVYQDGNCVRTIRCKLDDIEKTIVTLSDMYHINKVNLIEKNHMYSLKIKEHLNTQYANKNLDVTIW